MICALYILPQWKQVSVDVGYYFHTENSLQNILNTIAFDKSSIHTVHITTYMKFDRE